MTESKYEWTQRKNIEERRVLFREAQREAQEWWAERAYEKRTGFDPIGHREERRYGSKVLPAKICEVV